MAAFLLFTDTQFLERIGLSEFAQNNRSMLGLTIVVTVALFAVSVSVDVIAFGKKWWRRRGVYRRVTERLNCLTEDEKQILRYYLAVNTRANMLRIDDGIVQGLKADGIIYQSATLGNVLEGFAHNICRFRKF